MRQTVLQCQGCPFFFPQGRRHCRESNESGRYKDRQRQEKLSLSFGAWYNNKNWLIPQLFNPEIEKNGPKR